MVGPFLQHPGSLTRATIRALWGRRGGRAFHRPAETLPACRTLAKTANVIIASNFKIQDPEDEARAFSKFISVVLSERTSFVLGIGFFAALRMTEATAYTFKRPCPRYAGPFESPTTGPLSESGFTGFEDFQDGDSQSCESFHPDSDFTLKFSCSGRSASSTLPLYSQKWPGTDGWWIVGL